MTNKISLLSFFLLAQFTLFSQSKNNYGPVGSPNSLVLEYFKINFTKEQRQKLEGLELEFIIAVDTLGNGVLSKIHGLDEPDMTDSFATATSKRMKFIVQTEGNVKIDYIYFSKILFPKYEKSLMNENFVSNSYFYKSHKIEDFEDIIESGSSIDVLLGGAVNQYAGNVSQHLGLGGGMKVDLTFLGTKGWGGCFTMNFFFNPLKKEYPIITTRQQVNTPQSGQLGLGINKLLQRKNRTELMAQVDLCWAAQNVVFKEDNQEGVQFSGFSPGFLLHYLIQIGKDNLTNYYGSPSISKYYIDLSAGFRPLFKSQKEARGILFELGVALRMRLSAIESLKLK